MLVFFIHGVATRGADYSKPLQNLLKEEFVRREQPLPNFFPGFWGNVFNQTGQLWNGIQRDLQDLKRIHPQVDIQDIFRYREFREDFISQFFGDALTYFNTDRGLDIRDTIADQLYKFLKHHSDDEELHIVTHSLGTVIFWDSLFSDRFACDDPAYTIRAMIMSDASRSRQKVNLKSITTMGSPIVFFNMMLDILPEKVKALTAKYSSEDLRWLNLIHASDIIAYPLQSSMNARGIPNLFLRDKFIWSDANPAERAARMFGQTHAAMALAVTDAHASYWRSQGAARLIASNLLGDKDSIDSASIDLQ